MKKLLHLALAISTMAVCLIITNCGMLAGEVTEPDANDSLEQPEVSYKWEFSEESGTLIISGNALIPAKNIPWAEHIGQIVSVTMTGEGTKSMEEGAFSPLYGNNYAKLRAIDIEGHLTAIESFTFSGCSNLERVTFGEGPVRIGMNAFEDCTSLASITIPNTVESIENSAFSNCTSLEGVVIPNSVIYMEAHVFDGCTGLESATLPNNFGTVNYSTFEGCISLKHITIPDCVVTISDNAFKGCTGLESVTIGRNIYDIGRAVFQGCSSLTDVYFMSTTCPYICEDSFVYHSNSTAHVPKGCLDEYKSWEGWIFAKVVEQ